MSIALFSGQFLSSNFIGRLSDLHGRRFGTLFAALLSTAFGFLSALSPSYWSLCLMRFGVGLGMGCSPAPVVLLSEILPVDTRFVFL
jgi:MFS family permease